MPLSILSNDRLINKKQLDKVTKMVLIKEKTIELKEYSTVEEMIITSIKFHHNYPDNEIVNVCDEKNGIFLIAVLKNGVKLGFSRCDYNG